jgi:hypothetical protein
VAGLSGCVAAGERESAGESADESSTPGADDETAHAATRQLDAVIDAALGGIDHNSEVSTAFEDACIAEQGFDPEVTYGDGGGYSAEDGEAEEYQEASLDYWWGVSLPQYAEKYGYHDVDPADFMETWTNTGPPAPKELMEARVGAEYLAGETDEPGGCQGRWLDVAYEGVDMTQTEMREMASELQVRVRQESRATETALDAVARWSRCMAGEGYTYADPHAALSEFVTMIERSDGSWDMIKWATPEPTTDEIHLAVIDAQCKVDIGFWDAIDQAENEAAQNTLTSMRPQIEALTEANARLTHNVAKLAAH